MLSSPYLRVKVQLYFVSSSSMFLDKKTLLEILLNPKNNSPQSTFYVAPILSVARKKFRMFPHRIYFTFLVLPPGRT